MVRAYCSEISSHSCNGTCLLKRDLKHSCIGTYSLLDFKCSCNGTPESETKCSYNRISSSSEIFHKSQATESTLFHYLSLNMNLTLPGCILHRISKCPRC